MSEDAERIAAVADEVATVTPYELDIAPYKMRAYQEIAALLQDGSLQTAPAPAEGQRQAGKEPVITKGVGAMLVLGGLAGTVLAWRHLHHRGAAK